MAFPSSNCSSQISLKLSLMPPFPLQSHPIHQLVLLDHIPNPPTVLNPTTLTPAQVAMTSYLEHCNSLLICLPVSTLALLQPTLHIDVRVSILKHKTAFHWVEGALQSYAGSGSCHFSVYLLRLFPFPLHSNHTGQCPTPSRCLLSWFDVSCLQ